MTIGKLLQRGHAYDEDTTSTDDLRSNLTKARNHVVSARASSSVELDPERLEEYLTAALECLESQGADEETDINAAARAAGMTQQEKDRALARAKDGLGEVTPRAAVKTGSPPVDHRKDFKGGADSALFDIDRLMQR